MRPLDARFFRLNLPEDEGVVHFVNADLLAIGLSPLKPELGAMKATRLVLQQFNQLAVKLVCLRDDLQRVGICSPHPSMETRWLQDRNRVPKAAIDPARAEADRR
jgi:hypothetical protein